MRRRRRFPVPPRAVLVLYAVDVLIALAFTVQLVAGSETGFLARQLHPGREANAPTWFSTVQWALAGGLFAVYALFPPRGLTGGIRLSLPAAGALFLSLDETATFHEVIGQRSDALLPGGSRAGTPFAGTGIWALILVPIAVVAAVWVARLLADHLRAAPLAAWLILAGGILFVLGAGVLELATNLAMGNRPVQLGIQIAEEFLELLGGTTVVWGAFELLRVNGIRIARVD